MQEIDGKVCACDAIDVPLYLSTTKRDFNIHPIPPKDTRCVVFELKRPAVRIIPNDETDDDKTWPSNLLERLRRLPESKQVDVKRALLARNGSIVEINDVITSVLSSNTAAYLLGGAEQAKSILFYLLKYMTKDSLALTNSVTVINDALEHVRIHRSVADDSGSSQGTATHFLKRVINSLTGKIELSATQAASHLLNMPSFLSSTTHCFCFVRAAIAHVKKI